MISSPLYKSGASQQLDPAVVARRPIPALIVIPRTKPKPILTLPQPMHAEVTVRKAAFIPRCLMNDRFIAFMLRGIHVIVVGRLLQPTTKQVYDLSKAIHFPNKFDFRHNGST
jgi:hypothetical protein